MKKKMIIPLLSILTIGFTFTAQAVTSDHPSNTTLTDAYNTKPFFDKEKEINQGKNIIITP